MVAISKEEGALIPMWSARGETAWVIITKLLGTSQVTPLGEWDVCEADGIVKQKAAEFCDVRYLEHPGESGKTAIFRKVPCRALFAP